MYRSSKTDELIRNWRKVTFKYLIGRFWIDLLASLPVELIQLMISFEQIQFIGMLKLIRLLRLGRMITFLRASIKWKFGMKMLVVILLMVLSVHLFNCAWYYIIVTDKTWYPPKDLDFKKSIVFSEDEPLISRYVLVYYYAMLTLQAAELLPSTNLELITSILLILIGVILLGMAIGEITELMSAINKKEREKTEELDIIQQVMYGLRIPEPI
jgi:hypothetical protein